MNARRAPRPSLLMAVLLAVVVVPACREAERAPETVANEPPPAETNLPLERLGYTQGADSAAVTVIEFSDFGCPYCADFANQVYPALHREFVESGRVQWRYIPFVLGIFPNGDAAAVASECAAEQNRFWPMHDLLFQRQREWKTSDDPGALFPGYARTLGLDVDRFGECMGAGRAAERIRYNTELATGLGVRGTPSFLINGRAVQGALPLEDFRALLHSVTATGGATQPGM